MAFGVSGAMKDANDRKQSRDMVKVVRRDVERNSQVFHQCSSPLHKSLKLGDNDQVARVLGIAVGWIAKTLRWHKRLALARARLRPEY
jgi:hypothetical protein